MNAVLRFPSGPAAVLLCLLLCACGKKNDPLQEEVRQLRSDVSSLQTSLQLALDTKTREVETRLEARIDSAQETLLKRADEQQKEMNGRLAVIELGKSRAEQIPDFSGA